MTAPPLKKEKLTCANKTRHPDEITARAIAMHAIQTHGNTRQLFVYRCPQCSGWHLTRCHQKSGAITADNPLELA